MKQVVRYRFLTIAGKLTVDIRLTIDQDRGTEFVAKHDDMTATTLSLFPIMAVSLVRPPEYDENNRRIRPPFNPNDSIGMTKFTVPLFLRELKAINQDLKTPDLFKYINDRLEVNESLAEKMRRVFMIANTTVELSVVIIKDQNDTRMEGIKMKFNNEASSVALTVNELESLIYNIESVNVDAVALMLYTDYIQRPDKRNSYQKMPPNVDIRPVPQEPFSENHSNPY